MLQEDEKYKALRDNLRSLPRIKAKNDFEARLMQRINTAQSPVAHVTETVRKDTAKKSWFELIFRPAFVPAMGLSVVLLVAVVVYFAYYSGLNDGLTENPQQYVSSTNQGDLIIYVKNDDEEIGENYPKEYSAVEPGETRSGEFSPSPVESSTDFFAKPEAPRPITPELKPDRVSEEQKIEMQRSYDKDMEKGVDTKGERKLDDGIMKKESKSDTKSETKGMIKKETSEPKKKVSDEKKNILIDEETDDVVRQKIEEPGQENTTEDNLGRISRATKKDSTKNKSESEADDKEAIQKK